MEIGATGLPGLGAVTSTAVTASNAGAGVGVGVDGTTFSAALDTIGVPASVQSQATAAFAGNGLGDPKLPADSTLRLVGFASIDAALGLSEGSVISPALAELPGIEAVSPGAEPSDQTDPSSVAEAGEATPADGAGIVAALPSGRALYQIDPLPDLAPAPDAESGEPPVNENGSSIQASPAAGATAITVSPPSAPEAVARSMPREQARAVGQASMAEEPLAEKADGTLLERAGVSTSAHLGRIEVDLSGAQAIDRAESLPGIAPAGLEPAQTAAGSDADQAGVTAPLQVPTKSRALHSSTVASAADAGQDAAPGVFQRAQPAAPEASDNSGAQSEIATEAATESFARGLHNGVPERGLQTASASAPLPSAQALGPTATPPTPGAVAVSPAPAPRAEAHPMASFQADKVVREMGIQIARRVATGGDELVIRLDPAELGRINIRMSVNEHGQLRATVAADLPSVVEAIRNDVPELSRALEQAGLRTDSQSFRFDKGANGDSGGQWQQPYRQHNSANRHKEAGGHSMVDDEPAYRPLAVNGRINMMA